MTDWGSAALAFAAITGGIGWMVFFGYELSTLVPPMTVTEKEQEPHRKKAA